MSTYGTHAFLWETGPSFQPDYATAVSEAQLVWPTLLTFLNRPISVFGRVTDAASGLPLEGIVEIDGLPFVNGETNRFGGVFGRYRYFMPPGTYTIRFLASGYLAQQHTLTVTGGSSQQHDVSLQSITAQTGQPNHSLSTLEVQGFVDPSGLTPLAGVNGPFSVALPGSGGVLALTVSGPAQRAFVLLMADLNANNALFGTIGSLDIGLLGASNNFSDIVILLDGINPVHFMDQLAVLGSLGTQTLQFTTSALPSGIMGTMQALVTQTTGLPRLTAAIEIIIQ
jgi:hypothetical protein